MRFLTRYSKRQKAVRAAFSAGVGRGQRAEGRRFMAGTWSFQPLKKVLNFMATAIKKSIVIAPKPGLYQFLEFFGVPISRESSRQSQAIG